MKVITKTVSLPDGRTISIETGKVAKQCDGSCMLRMGNTVLLATVCAAKDAVPGTDFMPLQVDYREQYSAAGRFPGGFTKREGKPGDNEILTSRLVDRVLRPLFPSNYHAEVFVNIILFSADGVDQPDALAGFAASTALACSDIPFECPISEVRVARIGGEYVINPTFQQMAEADMDIMVGASAENIMMVEGEMKEVSEQDMIGALKAAMAAIKPMCELQAELSRELGKDTKREYCHEVNDDDLRKQMADELMYVVDKAEHDPDVRVLVIKGAEKAFSAGGDIGYFYKLIQAGGEVNMDGLISKVGSVADGLKKMSKIVITSVSGAAAGAGVSLAIGGDFMICADNAKFILAFVNLGLVPDTGATYLLTRLIGPNRTMELAATGRPVGAEEAKALGLAYKVTTVEELDSVTMAFAKKIAAGPLLSYKNIKKQIYDAMYVDYKKWLDETEVPTQRECSASMDFQEGCKAFMEKRKAVFQGK